MAYTILHMRLRAGIFLFQLADLCFGLVAISGMAGSSACEWPTSILLAGGAFPAAFLVAGAKCKREGTEEQDYMFHSVLFYSKITINMYGMPRVA